METLSGTQTTGDLSGEQRFSTRVLRELMARLAGGRDSIFTLYIYEGPNERVMYFVSGGVRLLSTGDRRGSNLESYLLDHRVLSLECLHEVLEEMRRTSRDLREVLLERKLLGKDEIASIISRLIHSEIMDLVFWDSARFSLYTDSPPKELYAANRQPLAGSLDLEKVCEEVCEWSRKWDQVQPKLHSDRAIISLTKEGKRVAADPFAPLHEPCVTCRESATLRSLARALRLEIPAACDLVVELLERKLVHVTPPSSARGAAALKREIERLEEALPHAIGKERLHKQLAHLHHRSGGAEKAAAHLLVLAESCLADERWPQAMEHLKRALSFTPEDIGLFKKTVQLHLSHHLRDEAVALGMQHAQLLLESGRVQDASRVARILAMLTGGGLRASEVLASALERSSNLQTTVEHFLELAREYESSGERKRAVEMLCHGLALDPGNTVLLSMLERLNPEAAARERKRRPRAELDCRTRGALLRRSLAAVAVLACVALATALAYRYRTYWLPGTAGAAAAARPSGVAAAPGGTALRPQLGIAPLAEASGSPELDLGSLPALLPPGVLPGRAPSGPEPRDGRPFRRVDPLLEAPRPASAPRPDSHEEGRQGLPATGSETAARGTESDPPPMCTLSAGKDAQFVFEPGAGVIVVDRGSREPLLRLAGGPGVSWAVSRNGDTVCRWAPGEPFHVYSLRAREWASPGWRLPPAAEALALGEDVLAVRRGDVTEVYRMDGTLAAQANLPSWSDGFLVERWFVLTRTGSSRRDPASVLLVDASTLEVVALRERAGASAEPR